MPGTSQPTKSTKETIKLVAKDPKTRTAFVNLERLDQNQFNLMSNLDASLMGSVLVSTETNKGSGSEVEAEKCKGIASPTLVNPSVHGLIAILSGSDNDTSFNLTTETVVNIPQLDTIDPSFAEAESGHDATEPVVIPGDTVHVETTEPVATPPQSDIIDHSPVDVESGNNDTGTVVIPGDIAPVETIEPAAVDPNNDEIASEGEIPKERSPSYEPESDKSTDTESESHSEGDRHETNAEVTIDKSQPEDPNDGDQTDGTYINCDVTGSETDKESGTTDVELTDYSGMSKRGNISHSAATVNSFQEHSFPFSGNNEKNTPLPMWHISSRLNAIRSLPCALMHYTGKDRFSVTKYVELIWTGYKS